MGRLNPGAAEVAVPSSTLVALRRAVRKEAGPLATIHALHDAGFVSGDGFFESLRQALPVPPGETGEDAFWEALSRVFQARGWGSLEHQKVHPALGLLVSSDWAEADPDGEESQPGCAFTAGFLAHVLTRVADGAVAVLEVGCRSRGDMECRFLFGSEAAIHEIYGLLLEGHELDAALSEL